MTKQIYYTVIAHKNFYIVKYAFVPVCEVFTFPGMFDTFAQAEEQFKQATAGKLDYLKEGPFQQKVEQLSTRYKQDLVKLAAWNNGKAITF